MFQRDFFGKVIFSVSLEKENMLFRAVCMTKITLLFLFSAMPLLGRPKISLRTANFQKKIATEVSRLCLPYLKMYFEEQQLSAFFFMAQITQIFLFSGMPLLER